MTRTDRLKKIMKEKSWTCHDVVIAIFCLTGETITPGCVRNWRNDGRIGAPDIPEGKLRALEKEDSKTP